MRFAEKYLTNGKNDPRHNPSTKSCLIRIPNTLNSKHKENVKVVQEWNGIEADAKSIILPFLDHLIQLKIEHDVLIEQRSEHRENNTSTDRIEWIEKILETPLGDNRHYCLWRILVPYLLNVKHLSKEHASVLLEEWLMKCNEVRKLSYKPQIKVSSLIKSDKGFNPISYTKLKEENQEVYKTLKVKYSFVD